MIPEIGQFALILALLLAIVQCTLPLFGAWRKKPDLMAVARPAAAGQFVFVVLAFAILTQAFVNQDFSVAYVAQNSNLKLPWYYRLSAVWGAHEGGRSTKFRFVSICCWPWRCISGIFNFKAAIKEPPCRV